MHNNRPSGNVDFVGQGREFSGLVTDLQHLFGQDRVNYFISGRDSSDNIERKENVEYFMVITILLVNNNPTTKRGMKRLLTFLTIRFVYVMSIQ
jgi:hypothetical protein